MREIDRAALAALAAEWRTHAAQRRAVVPDDHAAAAIDHCARELDAAVQQLAAVLVPLTTHEVAHKFGVSEQSVRVWCRKGRIAATLTPHGWRIPSDARPEHIVRRSA